MRRSLNERGGGHYHWLAILLTLLIVNGAFAQDSRTWEKKLAPATDEAAIRKQYSTIIAMNARGRAIVAEMQRVGSLGFTFRQPVTREEVEKVRNDRKAYTTALDNELQLLENVITASVQRGRPTPTNKISRPSKNVRQIDDGLAYGRALDERAGLERALKEKLDAKYRERYEARLNAVKEAIAKYEAQQPTRSKSRSKLKSKTPRPSKATPVAEPAGLRPLPMGTMSATGRVDDETETITPENKLIYILRILNYRHVSRVIELLNKGREDGRTYLDEEQLKESMIPEMQRAYITMNRAGSMRSSYFIRKELEFFLSELHLPSEQRTLASEPPSYTDPDQLAKEFGRSWRTAWERQLPLDWALWWKHTEEAEPYALAMGIDPEFREFKLKRTGQFARAYDSFLREYRAEEKRNKAKRVLYKREIVDVGPRIASTKMREFLHKEQKAYDEKLADAEERGDTQVTAEAKKLRAKGTELMRLYELRQWTSRIQSIVPRRARNAFDRRIAEREGYVDPYWRFAQHLESLELEEGIRVLQQALAACRITPPQFDDSVDENIVELSFEERRELAAHIGEHKNYDRERTLPLHLSNEEYHAETWYELIRELRAKLTEEEDVALELEAIRILDVPLSIGSTVAFKSTRDSIFGHNKTERGTSLPAKTDGTNPPPVGESTTAPQPLRTWTDVTGKFKVKARLVRLELGVLTLQRESAKTFEVPIDKLSEADRAYAQSNSMD